MSFVFAAPEAVAAAASNLAGIGSSISAANAAAAAPTTGVLAAAEDEVSTAIATVFGAHARGFRAGQCEKHRVAPGHEGGRDAGLHFGDAAVFGDFDVGPGPAHVDHAAFDAEARALRGGVAQFDVVALAVGDAQAHRRTALEFREQQADGGIKPARMQDQAFRSLLAHIRS